MKLPKVKSETRIVCDNCDKICKYPPTNFSLPEDWSRFRYNEDGRMICIEDKELFNWHYKPKSWEGYIYLCDVCSAVRDILL